GAGRRPDHQVGVGHVEPGIDQAGEDAGQPGVARRAATAEHQGALAGRGDAPRRVDRDISDGCPTLGCRGAVHGSHLSRVEMSVLPATVTAVARSGPAGEHPWSWRTRGSPPGVGPRRRDGSTLRLRPAPAFRPSSATARRPGGGCPLGRVSQDPGHGVPSAEPTSHPGEVDPHHGPPHREAVAPMTTRTAAPSPAPATPRPASGPSLALWAALGVVAGLGLPYGLSAMHGATTTAGTT